MADREAKPAPQPQQQAASADITVAELVDRLLDWTKANRSARTLKNQSVALIPWLDWLEAKGLGQLTAEDCRAFHAEDYVQSKEKWGPSITHTVLTNIKRVFSHALKRGYIDTHRMHTVEKPTPKARTTYVDQEAYERLLEAIDAATGRGYAAFRDLVVALWNTGARPDELYRLQPRHYRGDGLIEFPVDESKGKRRARRIILDAETQEIVERRIAAGAEYVFTTSTGSQWQSTSVYQRFARIAKKGAPKVTAYMFRHGFATRNRKAGEVSDLDIGILMGHSRGSVVLAQVYDKSDQDLEHMRELAAKTGGAAAAKARKKKAKKARKRAARAKKAGKKKS